ncbi:MAG: PqqD family protein, partial [Proteobacteria bacterium]|nr:PqqD family protein [Pseudomonadota bacterium]
GLFLTDQTGESVYHLNLVGAGVWRLLDGECGLDEAKTLLHSAFPDVSTDQIDRDTDRLVQDLVDQGLLIQPEKLETA